MKLAPITIYAFGISVALIGVAYGLFQQAMPNNAEAQLYRDRAAELSTVKGQLRQAQNRVTTAATIASDAAVAWRGYVATKTPPRSVQQGGIDLSVNPYQLAVDTTRFRNSVQKALNAQLKRGGVKVTGPFVPGLTQTDSVGGILASYYNYPTIAFPIVIYDLGQVTVKGTYAQITENVRAWSRMPRYIAIADGLQITGTSPNLTGTYNLQLIGFIRADDTFGPIPEGTAAAPAGGLPAGAGGRGFGGPPAGFGGPPGGIPGRGPAGLSAASGGSGR